MELFVSALRVTIPLAKPRALPLLSRLAAGGSGARGGEAAPHSEQRLALIVAGKVSASPVLPFAACDEAAHDEPGARHLT